MVVNGEDLARLVRELDRHHWAAALGGCHGVGPEPCDWRGGETDIEQFEHSGHVAKSLEPIIDEIARARVEAEKEAVIERACRKLARLESGWHRPGSYAEGARDAYDDAEQVVRAALADEHEGGVG